MHVLDIANVPAVDDKRVNPIAEASSATVDYRFIIHDCSGQ